LRKQLDYIIGGGNVAYCSGTGECHAATMDNLKFPNGLSRGKDGLIYVPSSIDGKIHVFALQPDNMLRKLDFIPLGMPLDNVSPDADGDLWVPGFPSMMKMMRAFEHPFEHNAPSTIFRIKKNDAGYVSEKVLEDDEGKIVSGVTTVRHDARTKKLFMGCEYTR
jgi:hypothetical protein